MGSISWLVGGDFNNILNIEERVGVFVIVNEISDFKNCLCFCYLFDIK